jgi:uncharacterized protein (TIGR03084 family)
VYTIRAADGSRERLTVVDLAALIGDLAAEQAALGSVLVALPAAAWERPTHAPGWAVRDQVAHLASFDEAAALAIRDADAFTAAAQARATERGDGEPEFLRRGRALSAAALLAWWRTASSDLIAAAETLRADARLPWYGPSMSAASFLTARLMETWSHGLDVVDVVDGDRPDTDRLRHVALLGFLARPYSYSTRGLTPVQTPIYVELVAPSGEVWSFGDPSATERIRGAATDFCRVVTRRRHVADTDLSIDGEAAREWMGIAQAFAGPPGEGRRPGQFPKRSAGSHA